MDKRKGIVEILAKHWEGLGKVSLSGEDVPIDNLEYKAEKEKWMMSHGSRICSLL